MTDTTPQPASKGQTMTDTASAAPSEREQFEAHATERGYKLARGPNDSYQYRDAAVAWKAWQARAALTTAAGVVKESLTAAHALPPGIARETQCTGRCTTPSSRCAPCWRMAAPATNPWREAVVNACMPTEACFDGGNPAATIKNLIDWHLETSALRAQAAPAAAAATPTAASIAWTALRDLTDPLGEAGVKIMGHVRIYAQRQYEAGLAEGRAAPAATPQADSQPALGQPQQLEAYYALLDAMGWESKREHVSPETWAADLLRDATAYRAAYAPADSGAAPAAGAVAGWKLAPVEPTDAMVQAAHHIDLSYMPGQEGADRAAIYRAMIAAAPTPPAQAADGVLEDAAFEAVRKKLCALPRYSFALDSRGNLRRCEDESGNWIEFDEAHALFDPVAVDAARKQGGA